MKITEQFSRNAIKEAIALIKWATSNGYTIDSIEDELVVKAIDTEKQLRDDTREMVKERIRGDARLSKIYPICPNDGYILNIAESTSMEFESELTCPDPECDYIEYLSISQVEWGYMMHEKLTGQKPEFPPEEINASSEERERRREVCKSCDELEGTKCKACGCSMKHRTYYDILSCPKEKW